MPVLEAGTQKNLWQWQNVAIPEHLEHGQREYIQARGREQVGLAIADMTADGREYVVVRLPEREELERGEFRAPLVRFTFSVLVLLRNWRDARVGEWVAHWEDQARSTVTLMKFEPFPRHAYADPAQIPEGYVTYDKVTFEQKHFAIAPDRSISIWQRTA